MNNNLLIDELNNIQVEYRTILINALKNISDNDADAVVDEIGVFWERNKKIVQCILRYLYQPYSAYVFTAATILDLGDYQHFPFVSLGKYHFWDDPIYKYITMLRKTDVNRDFNYKMKEQIESTIMDNIKIIDQAEGIIYILPIRLLTEDNSMIYKAADQAFFSMFKDSIDIELYKNKFETISDIKNGLLPGVDKSIFFLEDEDSGLDLETRFTDYKESTVLPLPSDATDAEVFWFVVYSYLAQAFDTILLSAEHRLVPYVRYKVTFKYILQISGNFVDHEEISNMLFKCVISHIVHYKFDKQKVYKIDIRDYYEAIRIYNFENLVFSELEQKGNGNPFSNLSVSEVNTIINRNFDSFFRWFHDIN
ncbi:hypothetical protein [Paenibacillus sp. JZ16]|uniref:hypothetical protein n=1 Tax=Paenibacillus sp. JZ16 TaxID=1906272 RepID=UPI00188BF31A|nr:hypothetical protein [Paenibacillus sp. JZ16]